MGLNRRKLLKLAGLTALGLSVKPGWEVFSQVGEPEPSPTAEALAKTRWAMTVDLKKCWAAKEGCRD